MDSSFARRSLWEFPDDFAVRSARWDFLTAEADVSPEPWDEARDERTSPGALFEESAAAGEEMRPAMKPPAPMMTSAAIVVRDEGFIGFSCRAEYRWEAPPSCGFVGKNVGAFVRTRCGGGGFLIDAESSSALSPARLVCQSSGELRDFPDDLVAGDFEQVVVPRAADWHEGLVTGRTGIDELAAV